MESAKECVTTHLPNQLALKMDGARAADLYSALVCDFLSNHSRSRKVVVMALKARTVRSA